MSIGKAAESFWSLAEYSVTGADEMRGMQIHMQSFISKHDRKTGKVLTMANRYIEGKTKE